LPDIWKSASAHTDQGLKLLPTRRSFWARNSPSSVKVAIRRAKLAITSQEGNTLFSVINTATFGIKVTIPMPTGPQGIALTANGNRAYITNRYSNNVKVIDTSSNAVIATIPVGAAPFNIAIWTPPNDGLSPILRCPPPSTASANRDCQAAVPDVLCWCNCCR
jgi:YVTN family beta-propeller protein